MASQYLTPIPQEDYHSVGLISAVVGFFLLAYFFMYVTPHSAIKAHTRTAPSSSKSWLLPWHQHQLESPSSSSHSAWASTCEHDHV